MQFVRDNGKLASNGTPAVLGVLGTEDSVSFGNFTKYFYSSGDIVTCGVNGSSGERELSITGSALKGEKFLELADISRRKIRCERLSLKKDISVDTAVGANSIPIILVIRDNDCSAITAGSLCLIEDSTRQNQVRNCATSLRGVDITDSIDFEACDREDTEKATLVNADADGLFERANPAREHIGLDIASCKRPSGCDRLRALQDGDVFANFALFFNELKISGSEEEAMFNVTMKE
jgi:hypothetical protein